MGRRRGLRAARRAEVAAAHATRSDFLRSRLRRSVVWAAAAMLMAVVLTASPDGFDAFQPPKAWVSQIGAYALAALIALTILRYGTVVLPRSWIHLAVAAVLATNALSLVVAEDRYTAFFGDVTRLEGLTYIGEMLVLYAAVATCCRYPRDWIVIGTAFAVATLLTVTYAVIQFVGLDPLRWSGDPRLRPFSTFGNADIFAHFLSVATGAAVGVALFWRGRVRVLAALSAIAIVAVGGLTGTRGFLLGLAGLCLLGPIIAFKVYAPSGIRWRRILPAGAVLLLLLVAGLLVTPVGVRTVGTFTGGQILSDRLVIYGTALDAFIARPLAGWGVDNFEAASVAHRRPDSLTVFGPQGWFTSAHDWPLETLVTTGILGALALGALVAACAVVLWTRGLVRTSAIAGPLALAFVGYAANALSSVGSVAVDWVPWVVFGGVVALANEPPRELQPVRSVRPIVPAAAFVAVMVATGLALPGWWANDEAGKAARLSAAGQQGPASMLTRAAIEHDMGRGRYWDRHGKVLAAAGMNRDAGDAFAEAARRVPYHFEYWNNLSVTRALQAQSGDQSRGGWPAAMAAVRSGLDRDPNNTVLLYTLAYIEDGSGDPGAALDTIARAIALFPRDPSYDVLAAQASGHVADPRRARAGIAEILLTKDSATLRVAAARAEIRAGDRDAAVGNLRRVLEVLDPANREAADLMRSLAGAR